AYKRMIVDSGAQDILYTDYFSGVHGNYLKPSIVAAGLDPDALAREGANRMHFASDRERPKTWSQIWGAGQGIGAVRDALAAGERAREGANRMNFGSDGERPEPWSQIWGAGQGIGAVRDVLPAGELVERLRREYLKRLGEISALAKAA